MVRSQVAVPTDKLDRTKKADLQLTRQAYDNIRERILRGQLPFGTTISRKELSRELGMSILPVSAALQRLQDEALIETVPRVGTMVRIPTPQDIRGFYVVREALESQAARLFSEAASAADRQDLLELAQTLDSTYRLCAASENPSEEELFSLRDLHMKFHLSVAEGARCPFLREAIEKNQILIFNWLFDRLFGSPGLPDTWHRDLALVLVQDDIEAADRAMRKHVRFRMDELLKRLEPYFSLNGIRLARALDQEVVRS